MQEASTPQGIVDPHALTVTDQPQNIYPPQGHPWFSFYMVNAGPDSVFVSVNPQVSDNWHEVRINEPYSVDMKSPRITMLQMHCNPAETAAIRLVGVR